MNRFNFAGVHGLVIVLVSVLLFSSCSQTPKNGEAFSAHVRQPGDVEQLNNIETLLTVTPEKAALTPNYQIIEKIAVPIVPEYRVGPGDAIELVYHIRWDRMPDEYRLEVQDKISIHFPYHPQFTTTVIVRPDGKITAPLLGDIEAESKTPGELARLLSDKYNRFLINPSVTVVLESFDTKIEELKRAISTDTRGQSRIVTVTPDGRLSCPLIGNCQAQGLTISALERVVNSQYSRLTQHLHVTLGLSKIHHARFYILGEVGKPGVYEMPSRTNLLAAIALAEGYKTSASIKDIVVFRNDGLERPIAFKVDLSAASRYGETYANLVVKPADIIYVPKTGMDDLNDLIAKVFTKGLYGIFPFLSSFSF